MIFGSFSHSLKCYECKTKLVGRRQAFDSFLEHACSHNELGNITECSNENPICVKTINGGKLIDEKY